MPDAFRSSLPQDERLPAVAIQESDWVSLTQHDSRKETIRLGRFASVDPRISGETFPVFLRKGGMRCVSKFSLDKPARAQQASVILYRRQHLLGGADVLLWTAIKRPGMLAPSGRVVALGQSFTPLGGVPLVLSILTTLNGMRHLQAVVQDQLWPAGTWFLGLDQVCYREWDRPMF